jgi:hypothetical protein
MEDKSPRFEGARSTFRCCSRDCIPAERLADALGSAFMVTPLADGTGYEVARVEPMQVDWDALSRARFFTIIP